MIKELTPHVSKRIWGGRKLISYKSLTIPDSSELIGETWEVSTHPEGISKIKNSNQLLNEFCQLKYLIKFLNTTDVLSIQVHPDNEYSLKHENQLGKFESWIVLEAEENAGIYLGFKPGADKIKLKEKLLKKEDVSELINFYPVKAGDFFVIPPGSIHAIGAGITLVEVQQSSGVTYRVSDWNRVDNLGKSRELHVEKAMAVLNDNPLNNTSQFFQYKSNLLEIKNTILNLVSHDDFKLDLFSFAKNQIINVDLNNLPTALVVLKGKIKIGDMEINQFQSFILLDETEINVHFLEDSNFIIVK